MQKIRTRLWSSKIPVRVSLVPENVDFFIEVPANSYFPVFYERFLVIFGASVPALSFGQLWLEYDGVPVKWNYPIGFLHDYLTNGAHDEWWCLKLHHTDYPLDYMIPLENLASVETYFKNQIKESCYIQHGSSKKIMALSREDSASLWTNVLDNAYAGWSHVFFGKLVPSSAKAAKRVPIKVYVPFSEDNLVIRDPVEASEPLTLRQFFSKKFPQLFFAEPGKRDIGRVLIAGIELDLDVGVWECFTHLVALDGFLHLVIVV